MKVSEVAAALGYEFAGDTLLEVCSVAYATEATENDLAIVASGDALRKTEALAVLMHPHIVHTPKSIVYCTEALERAAVRVVELLIQKDELPDYRTPCSYSLHESGCWSGQNCRVGRSSTLSPTCTLGDNVTIGEHVSVEPGVWVGSGVSIADNVWIQAGAKIGTPAFFHFGDCEGRTFAGVGRVEVGEYTEIGSDAVIQRGAFGVTRVGHHTQIGPGVVIGHDTHVGAGCRVVAQVGIAGDVVIGDRVTVYGQAGISNHVRIGNGAIIMAKARIGKDVPARARISGMYNRTHADELRMQARLNKLLKEK